MSTAERYESVARQIARYLALRQQPDGGFPGPDSYGVAMALWLWSDLGDEFARNAELAKRRLASHHPEGHGEFNAYALLQCRGSAGAEFADGMLRRIRFGRRHSANWMLLRAVCRSHSDRRFPVARAGLEARAALARFMRLGFIADRRGVRSFGYHCFCGALLADLWRRRGYRWAASAAVQAAEFISRFILPNGDALYVGRGQEQIFGYGALLYLLEAAGEMTGSAGFRDDADRVFGHLRSFQRDDGSFPLVLREGEDPEPWRDGPRPGWYSYNRYGDYLPFLACMLLRAARPQMPRCGAVPWPPPHPDFRVHRAGKYVAVLSRPSGATTNDLAFPYVCVDGVSLLPCYGTEGSAAPPEATPLPFGVLADGSRYAFRDRLHYRLMDRGMIGESALVRHSRAFDLQVDGFVCRDEITFRQTRSFAEFSAANFLFRDLRPGGDGSYETQYQGARAEVRVDRPATILPDACASASGRLTGLQCRLGRFHTAAGEPIAVVTRVRFQ
jgi:hypothetical protein